jgi:hypothetical protein
MRVCGSLGITANIFRQWATTGTNLSCCRLDYLRWPATSSAGHSLCGKPDCGWPAAGLHINNEDDRSHLSDHRWADSSWLTHRDHDARFSNLRWSTTGPHYHVHASLCHLRRPAPSAQAADQDRLCCQPDRGWPATSWVHCNCYRLCRQPDR